MQLQPVVVLLAAGAGTRFRSGRHKLLAELPENGLDPLQTVFERSLAHAVAARLGPIVVVTGALSDVIADTIANASTSSSSGAAHETVSVCHNERWANGQSTSVQAGIAAARLLGATSVIVGLADQPGIDPGAWQAVAASPGPIAVATYDGRRANPVKLHHTVWHLLPTTGDEGARALMRVRHELVREVPCTGHPDDIDTTEDLHRWQNS